MVSANAKSVLREWYAVGAIILIYVLGFIIYFPITQYPYGDSWFYSRNVYDTITNGKVTFTNAQAATPIFQVWLGAVICKLTGGFAFWKLNLLAYVFSLLAAVFTYLFVRLFTRIASFALLGTVLLIAIPPFFKTSMAFMTDPFSYFGMVVAFYYGSRYIGLTPRDAPDVAGASSRRSHGFLASIGFAIAILNRTNSLLTFLAYLGYVIFHRKKFRPKPIDWVVHIIPLVTFTAFQVWLKISGSDPYYLGIFVSSVFLKNLYTALTSREILPFTLDRITSLAKWAGYLGVFLLPLTIWLFSISWGRWRGSDANRMEPRAARMVWFVLAPMLVIVTLILVSLPGSEAIPPNTITEYGMGVKSIILPGVQPIFGQDFFTILQLIIIAGGVLLCLGAIGRTLEGISSGPGGSLVWWLLISTALFPLSTHDFSDRYLIPIFPLLFILLADGVESKWKLPRWVWLFPAALVVAVGLLANEYFGWNNARWKAVNDITTKGIVQLDGLVDESRRGPLIDAGLEYTAFRYYDDAKFLENYKAVWEAGGDPYWVHGDGSHFMMGYLIWWNLPKQYDYVVREEGGPLLVLPGELQAPGEIVGSSSYKPFPWSKPKEMVVYYFDNAPP